MFGGTGSPAASQRNHLCNEVVPWARRFVPVTSFLPWKNNRQTVVMELGSLWNISLKKKKTERIESVISKRTIANVWCQRPKPNLYTIIRLLKKMYLCYCGFDSISILNVFFHECAVYINSKLWFLKLCDEAHQLLEELHDSVNTYFQNDQYRCYNTMVMLQLEGRLVGFSVQVCKPYIPPWS